MVIGETASTSVVLWSETASHSQQFQGREDRIAVAFLQRYHGVMLDRMSSRATVGDGNYW